MKVKIGGSMGYKLQIGPYEPVDISSFIETEKEIEMEEQIIELQERIDSILLNDINKKVKLACANYKKVKNIMKEALNG